MPAPPRRASTVYVVCPACGERARAKFTDTPEGVRVEYTRRNPGNDFSEIVTFRDTKEYRKKYRALGSAKIREILRGYVDTVVK